MEIEFNASQNPDREYIRPVRRQGSPAASARAVPLPGMAELEGELKELSLVRPERVEEAKALAAEETYPSKELLEGIAGLLARKLKKG